MRRSSAQAHGPSLWQPVAPVSIQETVSEKANNISGTLPGVLLPVPNLTIVIVPASRPHKSHVHRISSH